MGQLEGLEGRHVTLTASPIRLENLFVALSSQVGTKLGVSTELRDEVVVLVVKDQPASDVLSRIAKITGASWTRREDELRLEQTAADVKAEDDLHLADLDAAVARWRKQLQSRLLPALDQSSADKWLADFKKLYGQAKDAYTNQEMRLFPFLARKVRTALDSNPAQRFLDRILIETDLKPLLAVPDGQTFVFSPTPNRMQRRLASGATKMFEEFKKEKALLAAGLNSFLPVAEQPNLAGMVGYNDPLPTAEIDPKAIFFVEVTAWRGRTFDFSLKVVNPNGTVAAVATRESLSLAPVYATERPPEKQMGTTLDSPADFAAAIAAMAAPTESRLGKLKVPSFLLSYFSDPGSHEMLTFSVGALLPEFAQKLGGNLIALLPDDAMWSLGRFQTGTKVKDVVDTLHDLSMPLTVGEGWITIEPLRRDYARKARVDWRLLKDYLSIRATGRTPSLREWLKLVEAPRSDNFDPLRYWTGPLLFRTPEGDAGLESVRWLAKLSPSQQDQAMRPEGIAFGSLSAGQRAEIEKIVFYNSATRRRPLLSDGQPFERRENLFRTEPTLTFPDGLPADSRIKLSTGADQIVYSFQPDEGLYKVDAADIGWDKFMSEKEGRTPSLPERILASNRMSCVGVVAVGAYERSLMTFRANELDLRKTVPYIQAPAWFMEKVRQGYERCKEQHGGF